MTPGMEGGNRSNAGSFWHQVRKKPELWSDKSKENLNTMYILEGQRLVNELRHRCDQIKQRLWIIVPYIGGLQSVLKIIGCKWIDDPSISFRILTDIDEFNNLNSDTIKLFAEFGEIRSLSGVHAKIFITDQSSLVTSANLTATAFTKRHEAGVFLTIEQATDSISLFKSWWKKASKVSAQEINSLTIKPHESIEEREGKNLRRLWNLPESPREVTYWLKPIGVTDSPITEKRTFGKIKDYLHFSTPSRKPKVFKGDILIEYGIGAKRILSVYRATTNVLRVTKEEIRKNKRVKRWPWYVIGKNLTPAFGKNWYKHNLYASELVQDYLRQNSNGIITRAGSNTLNALMRGKDKIKLDPHFAHFVMNRIQSF